MKCLLMVWVGLKSLIHILFSFFNECVTDVTGYQQ